MSPWKRTLRSTSLNLALTGAILGGLCAAVIPARADTTAELRTAQGRLDAATARLQAATHEQAALQANVGALLARLDAGRRSLEGARTQIADVRARIAKLAALIAIQRQALDRRAADAYTQGPVSGLAVVFGAGSLSDLQDRLEFLDAASRSSADAIGSLSTSQTWLADRQAELRKLQAQLKGVLDRLNASAAQLGGSSLSSGRRCVA